MADRPLGSTLRQFLRRLRPQPADQVSDGALLERFQRDKDQAAFAVLVDRHASLVLGVCRRVLGQEQDAEDAFQATFLILAKKAGALVRQRSIGTWLFKVARNLSLNARLSAARRRQHERKAQKPMCEETADIVAPEARKLVDAEIGRLPEKYRAPLVLCYLEGRTNEEAARALGWPTGSMARRLARARQMLHDRLLGRGVSPAVAAGLGLGLAESAPAALREATVRVAMLFAFPAVGVAEGLTPQVRSLVESGLHAMNGAWLKAAVPLALFVGAVATSAAVLIPSMLAERMEKVSGAAPILAEKSGLDRNGDPLPGGAVNRLGTLAPWRGTPGHSVVFSPDGATMATLSDALYLVDVTTGKELRHFNMFEKPPRHPSGDPMLADSLVVFSPDGAVVAAVSALEPAQTIRLWNVASGKELCCLTAHKGHLPKALVFSAAGRVLAARSHEQVQVWEVASGKELLCREHVRELTFSADGRSLATAEHVTTQQDHVKIWDMATGKEQVSLACSSTALAFSPDSKILGVGGDDGTIRLLEASTGRETCKVQEEHVIDKAANGLDEIEKKYGKLHPSWKRPFLPAIRSLLFSHDGTTLASSSYRLCSSRRRKGSLEDIKEYRRSLILWDLAKKQVRIQLQDAATSNPSVIHGDYYATDKIECVVFSRDDRLMVTAEDRFTGLKIRLWNVATGQERANLSADSERPCGTFIGFSRDERTLVTASGRKIHMWNVETGRECASAAAPLNSDVTGISLSPTGGKLAMSDNWNHQIILWDITRSQVARSYGTQLEVRSLACSPDGRYVATATANGTVRVWNTTTGQELGQTALTAYHEGQGPVEVAVAFSPDSRILAAAGGDPMEPVVRVWETCSLKEIWRSQGRACIAFSPNGKTLAVAEEGGIRFRESATGKNISKLECPGRATSLAFSSDGTQLAVGTMMDSSSSHHFMSLWDVAASKEIHRFPGHQGAVAALAFAPDGKTVASATFAGKVDVLDAAKGTALHDFPTHSGPVPYDGGGMFRYASVVSSMVDSPDGKMLAIAGSENQVALWEVATMRQRCRLKGHTAKVNSIAFSPDGQLLYSGSDDATVLVWGILRGARNSAVPSAGLSSNWDALADVDAAKGFTAMQSLAADPARAVPFLKERLRAAPRDDPLLRRWLADLESDEFAVRQRATTELTNAGDLAAPALRQVLARKPNLETRQRVEQLLQKLDARLSAGGEALRALRAIEVLEHIDGSEARAVLETVAGGAPGVRRTEEALAALHRLTRASSGPP